MDDGVALVPEVLFADRSQHNIDVGGCGLHGPFGQNTGRAHVERRAVVVEGQRPIVAVSNRRPHDVGIPVQSECEVDAEVVQNVHLTGLHGSDAGRVVRDVQRHETVEVLGDLALGEVPALAGVGGVPLELLEDEALAGQPLDELVCPCPDGVGLVEGLARGDAPAPLMHYGGLARVELGHELQHHRGRLQELHYKGVGGLVDDHVQHLIGAILTRIASGYPEKLATQWVEPGEPAVGLGDVEDSER